MRFTTTPRSFGSTTLAMLTSCCSTSRIASRRSGVHARAITSACWRVILPCENAAAVSGNCSSFFASVSDAAAFPCAMFVFARTPAAAERVALGAPLIRAVVLPQGAQRQELVLRGNATGILDVEGKFGSEELVGERF